MKTSLLTLFIVLTISVNGQSPFTTEVDEFTGSKKTTSDWVTLCESMKLASYIRFKQTDNFTLLNIKYMIAGGKVTTIRESDYLYLKLEDSTVVKIKPITTTVACKGCGAIKFAGSGAYGLNMNYIITKEEIEKLANSPISKIRLEYDYSNYYLDQEIKDKTASSLLQFFKLVDQYLEAQKK